VKRIILLALPLAAIVGGWHLAGQPNLGEIAQMISKPSDGAGPAESHGGGGLARGASTIRIASYDLHLLSESKLSMPVAQTLASVLRQFDVVAIQGISLPNEETFARLVQLANSAGQAYDFVLGPRQGRIGAKRQFAFVYDTARVEMDRSLLYTVADPDNLLTSDPLVAEFRSRAVAESEAITFSLINVDVSLENTAAELDALDNVFRAVRDDGRGEDDVIMLGNLNADPKHLGQLGQLPYLTCAIAGVPSNTRGTKLVDNILFDERCVKEFTGGSGVLDIMQQFGLSMADVLEFSDHLPVWAELSVSEGGRGGPLARVPENQQR
jgi:deoxyribonuclease-1-like protein